MHIKSLLRRTMVLVLAVLAIVSGRPCLLAQLPSPRLDWVFPPGGQVGTEVQVTISGTDLDDARQFLFSHPGIQSQPSMTLPTEVHPHPRAIANQFDVSIAADVPVGIHELRVVGRFGVSNPRSFVVGDLSEVVEALGNESASGAMAVSPEMTISGRAQGVQPDYFRVDLKLGQRLMMNLWAQRLGSRMDGTLSVCSEDGRTIVTSRDQFQLDPFLDFTAPSDGSYLISVFDFVYDSGNERFYRLSISSAPFVEYVFPPAVEPGVSTKVLLVGRNLPGGEPSETLVSDGKRLEQLVVEITPPDRAAITVVPQFASLVKPAELDMHGFMYRHQADQLTLNPVWISYATAPIVEEAEPNNNPSRAHQVEAPCEYVGQFYPRRDTDWIELRAKQGDIFWFELFSARLGHPTDAFLLIQRVVTSESGKVTVQDVAEVDDAGDRPGGKAFGMPSSDPVYRLSVAEDSTYRVLIRDLYGDSYASPRHVYRLSIRQSQPDFRLIAAPDSPWSPGKDQPLRWNPVLRRGGAVPLRVLVHRRDGFAGEIRLNVSGLPAQVDYRAQTILPAGGETLIHFMAGEDAPPWSGPIQITGHAEIDGIEVVHRAFGGTLDWDNPEKANPVNSRLTTDFALAVSDETAPVTVRAAEDKTWETSPGSKLSVPILITHHTELKEPLKLAPRGMPAGVKAEVSVVENGKEGTVDVTVEPGARVGTYYIVLEGKVKILYRRNPAALEKAEVERQIIAAQLAKLTKQSEQAAQVLAAVAADDPEKERTAAAARAAAANVKAAEAALNEATERVKKLTAAASPQEIPMYVASAPISLSVAAAVKEKESVK